MDRDSLIRKLRQLKNFEIKTRFHGSTVPENTKLVWDSLFRGTDGGGPRYGLECLLSLDKDGMKQVFDIFFSMVYYRYYEENGITFPSNFDAILLDVLELPYDSDREDVKRRFRQLAKKHHPDMGGDSRKFIELMETYNSLLSGK